MNPMAGKGLRWTAKLEENFTARKVQQIILRPFQNALPKPNDICSEYI